MPKGFVLCSLSLMILSVLLPPVAFGQGPDFGESATIVITFNSYDREAEDFVLEEISGSVSFQKQLGGTLTFKGNGTGSLEWDESGAYCTDKGRMSFPATIEGSAIPAGANTDEVQLSVQAYPGKSISDFESYAKEYS